MHFGDQAALSLLGFKKTTEPPGLASSKRWSRKAARTPSRTAAQTRALHDHTNSAPHMHSSHRSVGCRATCDVRRRPHWRRLQLRGRLRQRSALNGCSRCRPPTRRQGRRHKARAMATPPPAQVTGMPHTGRAGTKRACKGDALTDACSGHRPATRRQGRRRAERARPHRHVQSHPRLHSRRETTLAGR